MHTQVQQSLGHLATCLWRRGYQHVTGAGTAGSGNDMYPYVIEVKLVNLSTRTLAHAVQTTGRHSSCSSARYFCQLRRVLCVVCPHHLAAACATVVNSSPFSAYFVCKRGRLCENDSALVKISSSS